MISINQYFAWRYTCMWYCVCAVGFGVLAISTFIKDLKGKGKKQEQVCTLSFSFGKHRLIHSRIRQQLSENKMQSWHNTAPARKRQQVTYPYIHQGAGVLLARKHFRGSIRGTATPRGQLLPFLEEIAEAKVRDFDVHVGIEQEILRLEHTQIIKDKWLLNRITT